MWFKSMFSFVAQLAQQSNLAKEELRLAAKWTTQTNKQRSGRKA